MSSAWVVTTGRESKQELQAAKDAAEEMQAQLQQAEAKLAVVESALAASEAQVLTLQEQIRDMRPVTPRVLPALSLSAVPSEAELHAELRALRSQNAELVELIGQQVSPAGVSTSTLGGGVSITGEGNVPRVSSATPMGLELDFSTGSTHPGGSGRLFGRSGVALGGGVEPPPPSPGRLPLRAQSSARASSGGGDAASGGHGRHVRSGSTASSSSARSSPRRGPPPQAHELAIGDRLEIVSSRQAGAVAFVGPTHLGSGDWVGLVMDDCCGKHDGSIGDRRYFNCGKDEGLLLKLSQVRRQR